MKTKYSNITVNWKGKTNVRGLTETALILMQQILNNPDKKGFIDLSQKYEGLNHDYSNLTNPNIVDGNHKYTFEKELKIVEQYCKVVL